MVQINIDTEKDSPEMIAKIIEMLHAAIGNNSSASVQTANSFSSYSSSSRQAEPSMQSSISLPSSAPVSSQPSSMFDIFGEADRPNAQTSSSSSDYYSAPSSQSTVNDPFAMFDEPQPSKTETNSVAGYADNDLFNSFSSDLPSTDFKSQNNSIYDGISASFESAQSLLDSDFNPISTQEPEIEPKEEKQSNFFSFEQY